MLVTTNLTLANHWGHRERTRTNTDLKIKQITKSIETIFETFKCLDPNRIEARLTMNCEKQIFCVGNEFNDTEDIEFQQVRFNGQVAVGYRETKTLSGEVTKATRFVYSCRPQDYLQGRTNLDPKMFFGFFEVYGSIYPKGLALYKKWTEKGKAHQREQKIKKLVKQGIDWRIAEKATTREIKTLEVFRFDRQELGF